MAEFASKGWASLNTVLGSIGTAGATGILGGLFGNNGYGCSDNMAVSRYELNQESTIAKLQSENGLLKSNVYSDQKLVEAYKDLNGRLIGIEAKVNAIDKETAVNFAKTEGAFATMGEKLNAQRNEFICALNRERDERCCGDNTIVNYSNATFYAKQVADVTVGTTSTAQTTYNPLYNCGCGCGR